MEQRNEPSTAEIVAMLLFGKAHRVYGMYPLIPSDYIDTIIDRLERLERDLADEKKWHADSVLVASDNIAELERQLAAEKARADALVEDLKQAPRCAICDHQDCKYCNGNDMFTWRGEKGKGAEWASRTLKRRRRKDMSDKPKRDIRFGEIHDECKRVGKEMKTCFACKYADACPARAGKDRPEFWDMTDPPRFTEAQMAFLRGLYAVGITGILQNSDKMRAHLFTQHRTIGYFFSDQDHALVPLAVGETLDLAEMFGKEGAK